MQLDRHTPPGIYFVTGTLGSLIIERTATATGIRTVARPVDSASTPLWSGWRLTLSEPVTIESAVHVVCQVIRGGVATALFNHALANSEM